MPQKIILKTTMDCESCVAKVKPVFLSEGISEALKFNMASPNKTVEFIGTPAQKIQAIAILKKLGYEAEDLESADDEINLLAIYKPLILIGLFLLGITILIEIRIGKFDFMRAMSSFMGGFFLFFSFFKFLNLKAFADAFSTYDIIAKKSRAYAFAYPFLELFLGVAIILNLFPIFINIFIILILTIGNIGVLEVLRKKQSIQCACLGTIFQLPMTKITLFENSLMILMALISLIFLIFS